MHILVEDIKRHLNIDYEEDDQYLVDLIESAESAIEKFIQQPLKNLEDSDGMIPADLRHAIRMMVGGFYNNREPTAYAQVSEVPFGLHFLLIQYRKLK